MAITLDLLEKMNAYWRAANYLSVGQIYLMDNPLLKRPLKKEDVKPRLLGHFGTTPGLNFIYVHLNRMIQERNLNMINITGPGHGAPGILANTYLEGTYSEVYPNITEDEDGMKKFFTQFSFPGGIPSHTAPQTPGSIHEGGELGYSLAHAYGAAFDNPDLIVACVVGDGEAETGALATSWHSNKFLNPVKDGAVLPILHLNGYKIAEPTVLARIPRAELEQLFFGYGYKPYFVEGDDPIPVHRKMAETLDQICDEIKQIQKEARQHGFKKRPRWPMIIFHTPKGWTCPKFVDGEPVEGTFRSHQVPVTNVREIPEHLRILEEWLKSYQAHELFDENGTLIPELRKLAPKGNLRLGANPNANGGRLLRNLKIPDFSKNAVTVKIPGETMAESTRIMGDFLRDIMKANWDDRNFRIFGPDETASNRLSSLFEITDRTSTAEIIPIDDHISPKGRVMEVLSESLCQGWLEGYLLTGRHGLFSCYEAFVHIVDSMFNQHAKWLDSCHALSWRKPIASLTYLLTSHVWRQDHNGFSHQDPGFIDVVMNKKPSVVRVYLPPDANTLLSVTDHCLRSRNYINVIIAGKQREPQWLDLKSAIKHCTKGLGIWKWASHNQGKNPHVVIASAGDVPTQEALAAVQILREHLPKLKVRFVNVVNLMTLHSHTDHPHGISDKEYDKIFTKNRHIVFVYHGYPTLIHRLTYKRNNHHIHVKGYMEEGTTTTPFDMCVMNGIDRYHVVLTVLEKMRLRGPQTKKLKNQIFKKLQEHKKYIRKHGEDMPEIKNWKWNSSASV
ncbi:MAG TPA: phosphoketolase family protein [Chlamydiales bacterium]|nr:phosphoketolase family protein [Chlamydiales bacterium]